MQRRWLFLLFLGCVNTIVCEVTVFRNEKQKHPVGKRKHHGLHRRWIDVDDEATEHQNVGRQYSSPIPAIGQDYSSLLGKLDKTLSTRLKDISDVSILDSSQNHRAGADQAIQSGVFEQQQQQGHPHLSPEFKISTLPVQHYHGVEDTINDGRLSLSDDVAHSDHGNVEIVPIAPNNIYRSQRFINKFLGPTLHKIIAEQHKYIPRKDIFYKPIHLQQKSALLAEPTIHLVRPSMQGPMRHRPKIIIIRHRPRHRHEFERTEEERTYVLTCASSPCQNGGSCNIVNNELRCSCPSGYYGHRCETPSRCHPNPCKNNGVCSESTDDFVCTCPALFIGPICDVESRCHPNPCRNGGLCYEKKDSYECTCLYGFKGLNCAVSSFCHPSNPCLNGGICSEDDSSYKCSCAHGFIGLTCEVKRESCDISPCANGGTCVQEGPRSYCQCSTDFRGHKCEEKVFHACSMARCLFGGTCMEVNVFDFRCVCPTGRTGKRCASVIEDPCKRCHRHARCMTDGCSCKTGYTGNGMFCERIASHCHPNPCENGGICYDKYDYLDKIESEEKEEAVTPDEAITPGFVGAGSNELYLGPTQGTYPHPADIQNIDQSGLLRKRNEVPHPKRGNRTRRGFENDRSPPTPPPGVNENDLDLYGFSCICHPHSKGQKCEVPDPCNPNVCLNGGSCYEVGGVPKCKCPSPFVPPFCNVTDSCRSNPCQNGASCVDSDGEPNCQPCLQGFAGNRCQEDLCSRCHKTLATCHSGVCECISGYQGNGMECSPIPTTQPAVRRQIMLTPAPTKNVCHPNPCSNGGTCSITNTDRGYRCQCTKDFEGEFCQLHVTVLVTVSRCHPNPCLNGGLCSEDQTTFRCVCNPQYKGTYCEVDRCLDCDVHAICVFGTCKCRHGYTGDGTICEKVIPPTLPPTRKPTLPKTRAKPPPSPPPPPPPPPPSPPPIIRRPTHRTTIEYHVVTTPPILEISVPHWPETPTSKPIRPSSRRIIVKGTQQNSIHQDGDQQPYATFVHKHKVPQMVQIGFERQKLPGSKATTNKPERTENPWQPHQEQQQQQPEQHQNQLAAPIKGAITHAEHSPSGKAPAPYAEDIIISVYQSLGCWKDAPNWWAPDTKALPSLEGVHQRLRNNFKKRKDPIGKCADTVKELGYHVFAVENGGECFSSADAADHYKRYGPSDHCKSGVGAVDAFDVYKL